jgi:hypothetical protein
MLQGGGRSGFYYPANGEYQMNSKGVRTSAMILGPTAGIIHAWPHISEISTSSTNTYSTIHRSPLLSGSVWFSDGTQGTSLVLYRCNGKLYGIRSPTTASSSSVPVAILGLSSLNVPTMDASDLYKPGQTKTPISHDEIRTDPDFCKLSPQACLERFAEVKRPQSIVFPLL